MGVWRVEISPPGVGEPGRGSTIKGVELGVSVSPGSRAGVIEGSTLTAGGGVGLAWLPHKDALPQPASRPVISNPVDAYFRRDIG